MSNLSYVEIRAKSANISLDKAREIIKKETEPLVFENAKYWRGRVVNEYAHRYINHARKALLSRDHNRKTLVICNDWIE